MTKKIMRLRFKKWWRRFRPSFRKWLKACEKHMNSDEVKKQIESDARLRMDVALGMFKSFAAIKPKRTVQDIWDNSGNEGAKDGKKSDTIRKV